MRGLAAEVHRTLDAQANRGYARIGTMTREQQDERLALHTNARLANTLHCMRGPVLVRDIRKWETRTLEDLRLSMPIEDDIAVALEELRS